jgi:DNA repair exonuclease SbcCD nuclease subunit
MEIVVLADLHAENYYRFAEVGEDGRTDRLASVLSCLTAAVSYAEANEAELVLLGDLMSSRRDVDALVLNSLKSILSECPVPVHIVGGNHEQVSHGDSSFETSLRPLADYSKVHLYEGPLSINVKTSGIVFNMIPFKYDAKQLRDDMRLLASGQLWKRAKSRIFFIHAGLAEERHRYGRITGECISVDDIPRPFDLALFAHFHEPRDIEERVYIVGSPLMHSFKDKARTRGFMHISIEPGKKAQVKRVSLPNPKFITIRRKDNIIPGRIKGNYIRLIAPSTQILSKWKEEAQALGAKGIEGQVKSVKKPLSVEEVKASSKDGGTELDDYIERNPPPEGIDSEDVKKLANEIEYFS